MDTHTRAYYKWEAAGRPSGDGMEFWLQAEAEIQAEEMNKKKKKSGSAVATQLPKPAKAAAKKSVR